MEWDALLLFGDLDQKAGIEMPFANQREKGQPDVL